MLFVKWPRALTTALLCIFINTPAVAQSLKAQQATLAGYEKQLRALETKKQKLTANLSANKSDLEPLDSQDSPEKSNLDTAKALVKQTEANYADAPTSENKAKKSNAAFKFALAERKFKKANAQLFSLQQQNKELKQQLDATDQQISQLSANVEQQRKSLESIKARQLTAANKQKEQQQLQKQREAESEIQRLKAELNRQKQLQAQKDAEAKLAEQAKAAAKIAAARKAEIAPPKAVVPPVTVASTSKAKPATTAPAKPKLTQAKPPAKEKGAFLLTTKEQVQAEEKRLADLQTKPGKKRSRYNKILNIKTVRANGSISRPKANTLRALGNNQYKASVKLKKGTVILVVGFNNWRQTMSSKAGGTEYIFIYDSSDNMKPRLVYYDKALASK